MPWRLGKEALARLFFIFTFIFKYLFIFFYFFSLFLAKLFTYLFRSSDDEYDEILYEDEDEYQEEEEEEVEEEEYMYNYSQAHIGHLEADIVNGGETLEFLPKIFEQPEQNLGHTRSDSYESMFEDPLEDFDVEEFHDQGSNSSSEFEHGRRHDGNNIHMVIKEETNPNESIDFTKEGMFYESPVIIDMKKHTMETNPANNIAQNEETKKGEIQQASNFTMDEKFLNFAPPKAEAKKPPAALERKNEEMFEDTYTVGSTSKSSSEWRSSIRDSTTEDPSSSSSRRSCPKWESYTVYQKYDEEMMYLDRVSAQKLHETDSLRSFKVEPRSISQRIVHKLAPNKNQRSSEVIYQNTYHELEATYVAQICLAWEALNWNYTNFIRKREANSRGKKQDNGCPAHIAQQFQQFQVLLQRYIENEPYQRGRRPEVYARIRSLAPKLLQVPEYHDYEEVEASSRITSELFLTILEDAIRTFMNFLKTDRGRGSHCQVLAALFKGRRKESILIDPALLHMLKKHTQKMKTKLKDLQHRRNCLKRKRLPKDEETKVLMGLIDLKLVSRVLKMRHITQEQLEWCEEKMSKIKVLEGKLQRDSSPLFFPGH